jgi:hypothetical protein
VQLGAGAGSFGHDRVGGRAEPVGAGDVDQDVLAPGGEDLVAEQPVARVAAQRARGHVTLGQRWQDPDHHQVRTDLARPGLGLIQAGTDAVLEVAEPTLLEPLRRHVDLEVELAELGLEVRVGDRLERLGVLQRRVAVLVDQVELDLQTGHRCGAVEE